MSLLEVFFILIAGTVAGFMNTMAGGGSLITLPLLIFLGLPATVANGTNRISIMVQNISAVATFKHKGVFDWKISLFLGLPALLGAILGSQLAINLPDEQFERILAVVMIIILALIFWNPTSKLRMSTENMSWRRKILGFLVFFGIGIYGGFIQAGVGFLIMAALTLLTGFSLIRINAIKVLVVSIYLLASLVIFIINGRVDWILGITLAIGQGFGGWLGGVLSVSRGEKWIKIILAISVLVMAGSLLDFY